MTERRLVWFSCGAASAYLAKRAVEKYGDRCEVIYCNTFANEHSDNRRFFHDVEAWIGRAIRVIESPKYNTVDDVIAKTRYMAGVAGARCTVELKKMPRLAYQVPGDIHLFGYTVEEKGRASDFEVANPDLDVEWLLIEQDVTKDACLWAVQQAGIALPKMYELGFDHNNCMGCVKSQSPGYWNRTRRHFPEVFQRRCEQSRKLGVRLVKLHGERIFLDELPEGEDGPDDDIDCGPVCQQGTLALRYDRRA